VFSCLLAIYLFFYTRNNQADFKRLAFSDTKIDMFCDQYRADYQKCLRQELHGMIKISSPMQIAKISALIIHIYNLDLLRRPEKRVQLTYQLVKNYSFFINDIMEFEFKRDNLDLFQIFLFPYYRYLIKQDVHRVQTIIQQNIKHHKLLVPPKDVEDAVEFLMKIDIGMFKEIL
jgi:hypothetical protein